MTLDPNAEFSTPASEPTPAPTPAPAPEPVVTQAKYDELAGQLASAVSEVEGLRGKTAILDRLQEVFGGKPGPALNSRDEFVRKEILRLAPELAQQGADLAKIKEVLPQVLQVLGATTEERVAEKAMSAIDHMRGLMSREGLDTGDSETVGYMEEVLTREIKQNPELFKLWNQGNYKAAVSKAFDKANAKLFAPVRNRVKRNAVSPSTQMPLASPRGNAPTPAQATTKADFSDTSREGIKKIHDGAWERLQSLMDRD